MAASCFGQTAGLREAVAALQRGDFVTAERQLRREAATHPDDALTLSLLGAALDNLKRFPEADEMHRSAVAKAPRSIDVLNNYAAHLWFEGDEQGSVKVYRQVLALDRGQLNANLQLARLALKEKAGAEALKYLEKIPMPQANNPQVLLVRLESLYAAGDRTQGDALAARLGEAAKSDLNLSFAAGMVLSNARQFEKAEAFFETALKIDPANFSVLYDLGLVANSAGHYGRAREVLEIAMRQQPQNVDVMYGLACAEEALRQWEPAVQLLARAAKLDPKRADVQKMIALTATELDALEDAAAAWDRYLKLMPADEVARRERGYLAAKMGKLDEGIRDIEWFLARHPDDVLGNFELAQAERSRDMPKALRHFDKVLQLDPNYVAARTARGSLYYQEGKPESAVKDLEIAVSLRPDDAAALDRLGQTYQALDRSADAVKVLRRAAELAPADSRTLLHLARALADSGSTDESKAVMERFRQLGPEKRGAVPAGFVEYLSLTPEQRHADYRTRLEKVVREHPEDAGARVEYMKLLLADRDFAQAASAARAIASLKPAGAVLAEAGRALLSVRQYGLAGDLLKQAGPGAEIELAIATWRNGDAAKGMELLDRVPETARKGDYFLARAEMLDALGKQDAAAAALEKALVSAPAARDFYQNVVAFLMEEDRAGEVAKVLESAARRLPNDRDVLLMRAVAVELAGSADMAERWVVAIQNRWPEWYPAWVAHGTMLQIHGHAEEARKVLDTAAALGAPVRNISLKEFLLAAGALPR